MLLIIFLDTWKWSEHHWGREAKLNRMTGPAEVCFIRRYSWRPLVPVMGTWSVGNWHADISRGVTRIIALTWERASQCLQQPSHSPFPLVKNKHNDPWNALALIGHLRVSLLLALPSEEKKNNFHFTVLTPMRTLREGIVNAPRRIRRQNFCKVWGLWHLPSDQTRSCVGSNL